jgi:hypothetical protein
LKSRHGLEASGSHHAGVDGLWSLGHDGLADLRADAVGSDDEFALGGSVVEESSDNGLADGVVDADEPLVVVNWNPAALGFFDEDAMQRGASDHNGWLSIAARLTGRCTGKKFAELIFEGPLIACDAGATHLFGDSCGGQDIHAIGGEAECSARLAEAAGGLEICGENPACLRKSASTGPAIPPPMMSTCEGLTGMIELPHH